LGCDACLLREVSLLVAIKKSQSNAEDDIKSSLPRAYEHVIHTMRRSLEVEILHVRALAHAVTTGRGTYPPLALGGRGRPVVSILALIRNVCDP
jgi:hypothetical protein